MFARACLTRGSQELEKNILSPKDTRPITLRAAYHKSRTLTPPRGAIMFLVLGSTEHDMPCNANCLSSAIVEGQASSAA
eukprot:1212893-Amphidinium_carterae.1